MTDNHRCRHMRPLALLGLLALVMAMFTISHPISAVAQTPGQVFIVNLDYGVTPPSASLVRRAVREATAAGATALIVGVRSGGSVLTVDWSLARELHDAAVPVVTYIGPGAVDAGPAGALMLAASDVAAMAPAARAGFALPITQVPSGFLTETQQLLVEDAARELTGWQRARGRNTDWIDQAVHSGATIDGAAARALDPPVIDVVVATDQDLLTALQGRTVVKPDGTKHVLQTLGATTTTIKAAPLEWLGQLLAVPVVAFVLFVLGVVAIFLEFANPGVGVPGVAGFVLVVAALFGFVQADVRPWAVLLLIAGLVLVGLEHIVLSHGGLTLGGIILLVIGALALVDPARAPGLSVSWIAITGVAISLSLAAAAIGSMALRVRKRPATTGAEGLIGQIAEVRQILDPDGMVFVTGALWAAWTDGPPIEPGELVEVVAVENLRLYVRRVEVAHAE